MQGSGERRLAGKVFGLGLSRTGTTSLHEAMGMLGLRSAPDSLPLLDGIDREFLASYDAFFDNPIPFRYEDLDSVCPDSRYIITQRPVEDWLRSMRWLFGPGLDRLDRRTRRVGRRVHRRLYGFDRYDPDRLAAIYHTHYRAVAEWVADRPHVWLDLTDGLSWSPICDLLERPLPSASFPHSNPASIDPIGPGE